MASTALGTGALLACLGMLGPFSIDTYLPAFTGIAQAIGASPVEMQQTLSAYLFGFALMNLFHGALSDSFGRRRSCSTAWSPSRSPRSAARSSQHIGELVFFRALQGMSAGAGIVVSRAVIRDMFPPADAQRVMSQVTIYFGVAPAVAPMVGGFLFIHAGWQSIFWLLTGVGVLLFVAQLEAAARNAARDPQAAVQHPQPAARLLEPGSDPRFLMLALASGIPFNGMFLYVLSSPVFLGDLLRPRSGPVLLVLRPHHRRHHQPARSLGPHGRPRQGDVADPLRLPDHGRRRRDQSRPQPAFVPEAWWALLPIASTPSAGP